MSTSQRATTLHRPVLYNSLAISPPRCPMPMNAMFTRSLALISGEVGRTRPWAGVQNDGMADTADKASARLRNERREISSDFMVLSCLNYTVCANTNDLRRKYTKLSIVTEKIIYFVTS
jgi:hypothetical protein